MTVPDKGLYDKIPRQIPNTYLMDMEDETFPYVSLTEKAKTSWVWTH